jgi:hypothetical protein
VRLSKKIREVLNACGLSNTESILSEWNLTPDFTVAEKLRLQGEENAAFVGAVLSYFQDAPIDHAHFYRGDAAWMGLFGLDGKHFKTAYTFEAMGKMLDTPQRFAVEGTDTFGFTALAGRSADGKTVQILISNYAIPAGFQPHIMPMPPDVLKTIPPSFDFSKLPSLPRRTDIVYHDNSGYSLTIDHLPWGKKAYRAKRYRISKTQNLDLVEEKSGSGGSFELSNTLAPDAVELIVLQGR